MPIDFLTRNKGSQKNMVDDIPIEIQLPKKSNKEDN